MSESKAKFTDREDHFFNRIRYETSLILSRSRLDEK